MFPTLPKLKTYLMEEYHRRINAGLMPVTDDPLREAVPQLSQDQVAYRDELKKTLAELTTEYKKLTAEAATALAVKDMETYGMAKSFADAFKKRVLEAMNAIVLAKDAGFVRLLPPNAPTTTASSTIRPIQPRSTEEATLLATPDKTPDTIQTTPTTHITTTIPTPTTHTTPITPTTPTTPTPTPIIATKGTTGTGQSGSDGMTASDLLESIGQTHTHKKDDPE